MGSGFTSWVLEVTQKEYTGSAVYDKEAEVDHNCLITSNVMCLATIAILNVKPSEPCYLKIGGRELARIMLNPRPDKLYYDKGLPNKLLTIDCCIRVVFASLRGSMNTFYA